MFIKLFHQCGHNEVWNRSSFMDDDCGDGLIISPVHQTRQSVEELSTDLKSSSFFDPQYYLPNSQKAKLATYDFFPEVISGGFDTIDFSLQALESAKRCVDFQVKNGFLRVIIPARHFSEMVPDYIEQQEAYTVSPFLQAISASQYKGEIFLTLPVTKSMVMHDWYRSQLLNWVTSHPAISGIYLLVEDKRNTKQIREVNFLKSYMLMVKELIDAGLSVTIGHANTEGILFSLIDGCEITFGAYENTRMFSIDKFVASEEDRRGPNARIYVPGLFNWLRFSQAQQIRGSAPDIWAKVYTPTTYAEAVLEAAAEPHFNSPSLYKHFFLSYSQQVCSLRDLSAEKRYSELRNWLLNARDCYEEIKDIPIDLDVHGAGNHIQSWIDAVNWYYKEFLK